MTIQFGNTKIISAIASWLCIGTAFAAEPPFTITPTKMVQGKTYTVSIQAAACTTADLKDVKVTVSGSGTTLTQLNPDQNQKCIWTGTAVVAQDAELQDAAVILQWTDKDSKSLPIQIIAKAAGPIPPGLTPSVDVAWKVISRRVSTDNFGARVTKLYYPIEVVIGNNSGYDLQLASVEFQLDQGTGNRGAKDNSDTCGEPCVPSDSYFVVRASLEREQLIGLRSGTINVIKAIGPMLTGSAVFFRGASLAAGHHKATFLGITDVFSNPFEKGLEMIFPDQTVRQLINLDNHTLRDGLIIANNTQIRSVVFVDRELISRRMRNEATGKKGPQPESKTPKADAKPYTAETLGTNGSMFSKKEYDPQDVMKALGQLHLVGRSIAYLSRVVVISNPPGPAPLISAKTGDSATQGGASVTLTLTGDALGGAKLASAEPTKLVITNPLAGEGGKSFTATIDPKDADPKVYPLVLTTASGSITFPFTVNPADIAIPKKGSPQDSVSVTAGDPEKAVTVGGSFLLNVASVATSCTGVSVSLGTGSTNAVLAMKIVAIDSAPANDKCIVTATGKSGNTQPITVKVLAKPGTITINPPDPISIAVGTPGPVVKTVNITGTGLKDVTKVSTDCKGVTVAADPSPDGTTLPVKITVTKDAVATAKCSIILTAKAGDPKMFAIAITKP